MTRKGYPPHRFFSAFAGTSFVLALICLAGCDRSNQETDAAPGPATVEYGRKISFGEGGGSEPYRVSGWSKTEAKFTWTEGTSASLKLPIAATNEQVSLKMTMAALIKPPELPSQTVEVYVNDQKIAEWQVGEMAQFVAAIPASVTKSGGVLNVVFKIPKATSPKALSINADPRVLGICCSELELQR